MYDKILIPYDGSDEAKKGADHGIKLAASLDASIHGLYVMDLPGAPRAVALRDDEEQLRKEYREFGEEKMAELADTAAELGVDCETSIVPGSVSEQIVEQADKQGADAIVIASAYRGRLGNLLGGTTDKVVRTSNVPVITQRMQIDE